MRKYLLLLGMLAAPAWGGVHIMQGDPITTSSMTIRSTSLTAGGITVVSTGTYNSISAQAQGLPGSLQSLDGGVVNIKTLEGTVAPGLVVVSSNTDAQLGAGIIEIWQVSLNHNDPHFWIHAADHQSAGNIRIDSGAPNFELVNISSVGVQSGGSASGTGKWEPFAMAYQSARLQAASSRCWDNSSFDNLMYWEPMFRGGGMYLQSYDVTGCNSGAGYDTSSHAQSINWFEGDGGGNTVGLQGPQTVAASWTFRLPSTFSNGGQVLYQATSSTPRNWEFTTGGVAGQALKFTSTSGAPVWGTSEFDSLTVAQIGATTPARVGQMYYCSNCTALRVCVSTGTAQGAFSSPVAATTPCS